MSYELFIGWRYLFQRRQSSAVWWFVVISLLIVAVGAALFFRTPAKALGALTMLGGAVMAAFGLLLAYFSTFTAIATLGISIGVSMLIWVLSVSAGFQDEFREKVLGVNAHILIMKYGRDFAEYREVMKTAERVPGVIGSAPFVFNEMILAGGGPSPSGVMVKGIEPRFAGRVLDLPGQIEKPHRIKRDELPSLLPRLDEQALEAGKLPGILIGRAAAEKQNIKLGETVRLISPLSGLDMAGWSANAEIPRSLEFQVTGIFFSGFNEYDRRLVYVHMHDMQRFMGQGDVVTAVDLKVADVFRAKELGQEVLDALGGSPYRFVDWGELNHNLFTALAIQKLFMRVFIGLIVLVAALNVLAALTVLTVRKTRQVSILKCLGMQSGGVFRIFASSGIIVWFIGTGTGLLYGYLGGVILRMYGFPLDAKVYHIDKLPVRMEPIEFVLTAVFALFLVFFATLYPAIRARRVHPLDGLREE